MLNPGTLTAENSLRARKGLPLVCHRGAVVNSGLARLESDKLEVQCREAREAQERPGKGQQQASNSDSSAPVCADPPQEPGRFLATPTQEETPCLVQAAYVAEAELKMEYHKRIPKAQQAHGGPRPALPPPISPAYRSVITQSLSHSVALSIPL